MKYMDFKSFGNPEVSISTFGWTYGLLDKRLDINVSRESMRLDLLSCVKGLTGPAKCNKPLTCWRLQAHPNNRHLKG